MFIGKSFMKQLITSLCMLFVCNSLLQAQPFSAYTDIRNEFYAFDNGALHRLEGLAPVNVKIGRSGILYHDNQRILKLYRDGGMQTVTDLFTSQFEVSDNLMLFRSANMIAVIDDGQVTTLSGLCDRYALGDSIVVFYDNNRSTFNAYYHGKTTELESVLNTNTNDFQFGTSAKVSDNICAYINFNDQLKVFFQNNIETIENQVVNSFEVGRNTVGYVDINNIFKVYHKGQVYTLDPFKPKSYMVGDDIVAFQSSDGYFKVFYNGQLFTMGYYEPKYQLADRVLAFQDLNGFFKVFYDGAQVMVDNYYPEKMKLAYNSLAYVNKAGILRYVYKGKVSDVTMNQIAEMRLDYDVLQYKIGYNAFRFFFDGENYN
jgi:hypothetical protein